MGKKPISADPFDKPCSICSYIASSLLGGVHAKAFTDPQGRKIKLVIEKMMQPPEQLRLKDNYTLPVCKFCGSFLIQWIKMREQLHERELGEKNIVVATPREVMELTKQGPAIILPTTGGKILGESKR